MFMNMYRLRSWRTCRRLGEISGRLGASCRSVWTFMVNPGAEGKLQILETKMLGTYMYMNVIVIEKL